MRQFGVHRYLGRSAQQRPFLLVVQSNQFKVHPTYLAVPLVSPDLLLRLPMPKLSPCFVIGGRNLLMATLDLGSFPRIAFGELACSLEQEGDRIADALDTALARGYL